MLPDLTAKSTDEAPHSWSWKPADLLPSIKKLAVAVEKNVVDDSEWYMAKRKLPARGARWSRVAAIAFVTLGGLSPLIWSTFEIKITQPFAITGTGVGYLCLALAAASVALDRYAGFSSSWMRRITTAHALKRLVVEFRVEWAQLLAEVEGKEPLAPADAKPLFDRLSKLASDAEELIKEETRLWKVEFESAFAQLEKATQAQKAESQEQKPAAPKEPKPLASGASAPAGQDVRMEVKPSDAPAAPTK